MRSNYLFREKNIIRIWNNGRGIPIEMHKEQKLYVPSMIFGHLLTSSNYDDSEKKVVGGRNGFGAKLCNIFSTKFTVETATGGKIFKQVCNFCLKFLKRFSISLKVTWKNTSGNSQLVL